MLRSASDLDLGAIIRAQAAYAACIDDGDLADWPGYFTEDAHYSVTTAENYRLGLSAGIIYAESRAMLEDRVVSLREANVYERHAYRHVLGLPAVEPDAEGGMRAVTPFLVVRIMRTGESAIFATGRYVDRYVAIDGEPKLARRVAVCDSSRIDTLLALPL